MDTAYQQAIRHFSCYGRNLGWGQLASAFRSSADRTGVADEVRRGAGAQPLPSRVSVASGPRERHERRGPGSLEGKGSRSVRRESLAPHKLRQGNNLHKHIQTHQGGRPRPGTGHPSGQPRHPRAGAVLLQSQSPHTQRQSTQFHLLGDGFRVKRPCGFFRRAIRQEALRLYSLPHSIMEDSKNSKPVDVIRLRGVSASIYANKVKDRSFPLYKVSIKRTYKKNGEFKSVTSLGRDDLPAAALLLNKAWVRILELEGDHWKNAEEDQASES